MDIEGQQTSTPGVSRQSPDDERVLLAEERADYVPGSRLTRVLTSFTCYVDGVPVPVCAIRPEDEPSNVVVVGIVGTTIGKEGLFAQCGWFGDNDLDWFWVRLEGIRELGVRRDSRFRAGALCVWLVTDFGNYAMLLPHKDYIDDWEQSLHNFGTFGPGALCRQWPTSGVRPKWWSEQWEDAWPFDKSPLLKRRASTELAPDDTSSRREVADSSAGIAKWPRLGPLGDTRRLGEEPTNVSQRASWAIARDEGMMPTRQPKSSSTGPRRGKVGR